MTLSHTLDFRSPLPLYHQIQRHLAGLIENGTLTPGASLPSERELSDVYSVNRITVRQALNGLCSDGLLERRRGIGTFVAQPKMRPSLSPSVAGFSERIHNSGMRPTSRVLSFVVEAAAPLVARSLRLDPAASVICLRRLRCVDGEPLMIETSWLPYAPLSALMQVDFNAVSLYATLAGQFNRPVMQAEHTLEPILLHTDEAPLFDLKAGQPAMLVYVLAFTHDQQPIEFSKAVIRGDRCRYYFTATVGVNAPSGAET